MAYIGHNSVAWPTVVANTSNYSMGELTVGGTILLDNTGRIGIGTTSPGDYNSAANDLVVGTTDNANHGISIASGSGYSGSIYFSDATSGAGEYAGYVIYNHSSNYLSFGANQSEKMRLDSSGKLGIGTTAPDGLLHVHTGSAGSVTASADADELVLESSGNAGMSLLAAASGNAQIYFGEATDNDAAFIQYNGSIDDLIVSTTNAGSKLILKSDAGVTQVTFDGAAGSQFAEFANDIGLKSDHSKIYFGADNDVTLTHVPDTGLLLNSTRQLQFRDSALKIYSSADGQLDIAADTEIELTSTTVAVEGILNVSGTSWLYNDVYHPHDGVVIHYGADHEITLTHVPDSGLRLADNDKMLFGSDSDSEIYHNGSNFYISTILEMPFYTATHSNSLVILVANYLLNLIIMLPLIFIMTVLRNLRQLLQGLM